MGAKQTRDADGLTELERRFATYYLESFNATEAYIKASPRKVTRKTAEANGYRLLQRDDIQSLVRAQRDRLMEKAELSVEDVLKQLKRFLMYDARKLFNEHGGLKPMAEWPEDVAMAVTGVKDTMAGREIKLVDKAAALEKAMKYHGLFERDNKQKGEAIAEVVFSFVKPGEKPQSLPSK